VLDDRLTEDDDGADLVTNELDPREHPVAVHLAGFGRYVVVYMSQAYPERWGHFLVTLAPKEREGEPNAGTVRPLAVQPFFRLSFEGVTHAFVTRGDHSWARTRLA
jgi:hypothetical protein